MQFSRKMFWWCPTVLYGVAHFVPLVSFYLPVLYYPPPPPSPSLVLSSRLISRPSESRFVFLSYMMSPKARSLCPRVLCIYFTAFEDMSHQHLTSHCLTIQVRLNNNLANWIDLLPIQRTAPLVELSKCISVSSSTQSSKGDLHWGQDRYIRVQLLYWHSLETPTWENRNTGYLTCSVLTSYSAYIWFYWLPTLHCNKLWFYMGV